MAIRQSSGSGQGNSAYAATILALAKLERYDEAIEQYRAVLAKKDNAGLRLNLALAYYKKGALREAVQQLSTLQGAQPGDTRVATLLADCYARLGQDRQAIAVLTPVEAAHPDDLAVAWLLGSALIRAGHKRDGLERVDRVDASGGVTTRIPNAFAADLR